MNGIPETTCERIAAHKYHLPARSTDRHSYSHTQLKLTTTTTSEQKPSKPTTLSQPQAVTSTTKHNITSHTHSHRLCDSGKQFAIIKLNLTHDATDIKVTMPSHLRLQSTFEPFTADAHYQTSPTLSSAKKQKMSLTRTYAVASTARSKLGREASRADHNLRRLVGHANLLDTLMIDLADAEREQEAWFNSSVSKATPSESRHIQWFDSIQEDFEDDSDSDSDDESDDGSIYDEDAEILNIPVRRIRAAPVVIESEEIFSDDEDDAEFDEEFDDEHTLVRVPSRHSPPELALDDSDSEDDSMPPSPDQPTMELNEKERQQLSTALYGNNSQAASMEDYIMHEPQRPLISAY